MDPIAGGTPDRTLTRLLIVDDHPIVREGLAQLLAHEPDLRVDWGASSLAEALEICRSHAPDLAIVDISLGDGSGIELVRAMHVQWPSLPVLVMSMHDEDLYADRAIRAGARGYIMKHVAPRHIVEAIRRVRQGLLYLSDKVQSKLIERVIDGGDGAVSTALTQLSDRELEVFHLIGKGLKKGEIAARLNRSANTIEAHRTSIKKKLKVDSGADLARLAFLYTQKE